MKDTVNTTDLGDVLMKEIFDVHNQALKPFHDKNVLGLIVFQFQANIKQTDESWFVLLCLF